MLPNAWHWKKVRSEPLKNRRGQSTVEYVLVISVLVIAMALAAEVLIPTFSDGLNVMQQSLQKQVADGVSNNPG